MKKIILTAVLFLFALGLAQPASARGHVAVFANFGCCGYSPYPYYYPAYYYPYYVAPPPVVYAVPPPSPVVYAAPPPVAVPAVSANQTSPTFIDSEGRTCRQFQSTGGGPAYGTACLMPDGSWRAVQ